MLTILFEFPSGRFHATPWGRHVNEGAIEWPPSPWRIYRAWIATGFSKLGWTEVPKQMRTALEKLAGATPLYALPPAASSHTRHYMPQFKGSTAKVLDSFAFVGRNADAVLGVRWETELQEDELRVVDEVLAALGYLGRAESWIAARRADDLPDHLHRCTAATAPPGPGFEPVSLLAPMPEAAYQAWRDTTLADARARRLAEEKQKAEEKNKKPPARLTAKVEQQLSALFPPTMVDALLATTRDLQDAGWSQPPGSVWLTVWRSVDALSAGPDAKAIRKNGAHHADTALLAVTSDTRRQEALPRMKDAIRRAEQIHATLVKFSSESNGKPSVCLAGKNAEQQPLQGHRHAVVCPLDLDGDDRMDHVLVHAPMGLDHAAREALARVRRTWAKNLPDLFVTLAGLGRREDFANIVPMVRQAKVWMSVTPFVPPRHLKAKGKDSLAGQVRAELETRGLPEPESIEVEVDGRGYVDCEGFWALWKRRTPGVVMGSEGGIGESPVRLATRWRHYRKARGQGAPQPPVEAGFGVRITFREVVRGPICLGYGGHFGLGGFGA